MVEALSQWRLRELLAEVQDRIAQVVDVHDRMDRLIDAMLVITSGPDLDETLRTIVAHRHRTGRCALRRAGRAGDAQQR